MRQWIFAGIPAGMMRPSLNFNNVVSSRYSQYLTIMKSGLLLALIMAATVNHLLAQEFSSQLQSMVDAERAFAKFSKEKNMRDAFLENLTDRTVLFSKDGPIIGKQSWIDRQPNNNLLIWWPVFVGISSNNEMGFSTGPSQWSETKESQTAAHGYFVSVWKKVGGEWKLAADIGSPMPGADVSAAALHSSNPTGKAAKSKDVKGLLLDIDRKYNDHVKKAEVLFDSERFSKDAMLKYPRAFPDYFPFESKTTLSKADFKSLGGDVSSSNDLAYTYGRVNASLVDNSSVVPYAANFLRVWKYEEDEWKIVIEVVSGE